jgi:hypothetical protein
MNNEAIEREAPVENHEGPKLESKVDNEPNAMIGAEMLEEPKDGSFTQGLQLFVAWVASLLAPKDKP